jgi:hypothetical protein
MAEQTVTRDEIAEICKVAKRTAGKWIDGGRIRLAYPDNMERTVFRSEVVRFLQEHGMPLHDLERVCPLVADPDDVTENAAYKCFKCGGTDLQVEVSQFMVLKQGADGNVETTDDNGGDHHWNEESSMFCSTPGCEVASAARDFMTEAEEGDD